MEDASALLGINPPAAATCARSSCTMSAETQHLVHNMETVLTNLNGHFTAAMRLDLVQSSHPGRHSLKMGEKWEFFSYLPQRYLIQLRTVYRTY